MYRTVVVTSKTFEDRLAAKGHCSTKGTVQHLDCWMAGCRSSAEVKEAYCTIGTVGTVFTGDCNLSAVQRGAVVSHAVVHFP